MKRNIAVCIILSIVTCGIYSIYWMYELNQEVAALTGSKPRVEGALLVLLAILTCNIFVLYWMYVQGDTLDKFDQAHGKSSSSSALVFLILSFFGLGIVSLAIMQDRINSAFA